MGLAAKKKENGHTYDSFVHHPLVKISGCSKPRTLPVVNDRSI
jgi:hypothetical protein